MAAWCISADRDVPRLARHPGIAVGVRARGRAKPSSGAPPGVLPSHRMTILVPSGISSRAIKVLAAKGLVESRPRIGTSALAVVEAIGRADPAGARESMEALIASTARGAGSVVEGRPAIGRNT
jgi:hypothetical protein